MNKSKFWCILLIAFLIDVTKYLIRIKLMEVGLVFDAQSEKVQAHHGRERMAEFMVPWSYGSRQGGYLSTEIRMELQPGYNPYDPLPPDSLFLLKVPQLPLFWRPTAPTHDPVGICHTQLNTFHP